jgi:hypothetical protein
LENNGLGPYASQATAVNQRNDSYAVFTNRRFLFQVQSELFFAASDTALTSEGFSLTLQRYTPQAERQSMALLMLHVLPAFLCSSRFLSTFSLE